MTDDYVRAPAVLQPAKIQAAPQLLLEQTDAEPQAQQGQQRLPNQIREAATEARLHPPRPATRHFRFRTGEAQAAPRLLLEQTDAEPQAQRGQQGLPSQMCEAATEARLHPPRPATRHFRFRTGEAQAAPQLLLEQLGAEPEVP